MQGGLLCFHRFALRMDVEPRQWVSVDFDNQSMGECPWISVGYWGFTANQIEASQLTSVIQKGPVALASWLY
jgi:hypothetical protein